MFRNRPRISSPPASSARPFDDQAGHHVRPCRRPAQHLRWAARSTLLSGTPPRAARRCRPSRRPARHLDQRGCAGACRRAPRRRAQRGRARYGGRRAATASQKRRRLGRVQRLALGGHEVAERDGGGGSSGGGLAGEQRRSSGERSRPASRQAPAVEDRVVLGEGELERRRRRAGGLEAQLRRRRQVEGPALLGARGTRRSAAAAPSAGEAPQVVDRDRQLGLAVHELQRLGEAVRSNEVRRTDAARTARSHRLAEGGAASNGALQVVAVDVVVERRLGRQLHVEEHAGLEAGERVGVLHALRQPRPVRPETRPNGAVRTAAAGARGLARPRAASSRDRLVLEELLEGELEARARAPGRSPGCCGSSRRRARRSCRRRRPARGRGPRPRSRRAPPRGRCAARRSRPRAPAGEASGRRQGAAVELAVGGERQARRAARRPRAPCSRAGGLQERAQLGDRGTARRRRRRRRRPGAARPGASSRAAPPPRAPAGARAAPPRSRPARCGSRGS